MHSVGRALLQLLNLAQSYFRLPAIPIEACSQLTIRVHPGSSRPELSWENTRLHTTGNLSLNAPGPNKSVKARCLSQPRRLDHTRDSSDQFAEQMDWFSAAHPDASGSYGDPASMYGLCLVARVAQMQHVARPQARAMSHTLSRLGVTREFPLGFLFWNQSPPSDASGSDASSPSLLFLLNVSDNG